MNQTQEVVDVQRKQRIKKRKRKKIFKRFLTTFGIIIIAIAVFVITVKLCQPDYDFKNLIPKNAVTYIKKDIFKKTNTTTTKQTTTKLTTGTVDYLAQEDFGMQTSLMGNYLGNLLGKQSGAVSDDGEFIYNIVKGKGIVRFSPISESTSVSYSTKDNISFLNLKGENFYYINKSDNNLYKLPKYTSNPVKIADNVRFVYVYDKNIYYITNDEKVCMMSIEKLEEKVLYSSNGGKISFVGISKDRVFFKEVEKVYYYQTIYETTTTTTTTDSKSNTSQTSVPTTKRVRKSKMEYRYLTIDNSKKTKVSFFTKTTNEDEMINLQMENGFMYYYKKQNDGSYNLCRQKFGSDNVVTLINDTTTTDYPIIVNNCLYYSEYKDNTFRMKELNMNSNSKKTMLYVNDVSNDNTLACLYGSEYQYIIGKKSENDSTIYKNSCIYTASNNAMYFDNNKFKY